MRKLKTLFKIGLVGSLCLTITLNTFASDTDRISLLEKEVQELKLRLIKIEAQQSTPINQQKSITPSNGLNSVDSWRSLRTGMSPDDVKKTLGEPTRVDGGLVAYWIYPNQGEVTFVRDRVTQWREPR